MAASFRTPCGCYFAAGVKRSVLVSGHFASSAEAQPSAVLTEGVSRGLLVQVRAAGRSDGCRIKPTERCKDAAHTRP